MKHVAGQLAVTALLVFAHILCVDEAKGQTTRQFLVKPGNHIQFPLGSCVNLTWTYRLGENDSIMGVSFGVWSFPGYVSKKLLIIKPNGLPLIRPTYEKKVQWVGDFGNSTAALQICNVTIGEATDYGVHIELGLHKNPMTDTIQLNTIGARKQVETLTVLEGETATKYWTTTITESDPDFVGYRIHRGRGGEGNKTAFMFLYSDKDQGKCSMDVPEYLETFCGEKCSLTKVNATHLKFRLYNLSRSDSDLYWREIQFISTKSPETETFMLDVQARTEPTPPMTTTKSSHADHMTTSIICLLTTFSSMVLNHVLF